MTEHFNGLTPAEAERLAMLAEETGEIVQMVGKILRHGYESYHPDDKEKVTNRTNLFAEILDIYGVMYGMGLNSDVPHLEGYDPSKVWKRKSMKYTHHQDNIR